MKLYMHPISTTCRPLLLFIDTITIADYFGTGLTTIGEWVHCDISAYPNVTRWLDAMKSRPSYQKINNVFNGFVESTKGKSFLGL